MTLKEIEKVITESSVVYDEINEIGLSYYLHLRSLEEKSFHKEHINKFIERGDVLYYYKRNEETGEMTLLAKVDHIDKKMKVIKKKLGEMTNEETDQVKQKICFDRKACTDCPLQYKSLCLATYFKVWKNLIKETENREFEVEVEE